MQVSIFWWWKNLIQTLINFGIWYATAAQCQVLRSEIHLKWRPPNNDPTMFPPPTGTDFSLPASPCAWTQGFLCILVQDSPWRLCSLENKGILPQNRGWSNSETIALSGITFPWHHTLQYNFILHTSFPKPLLLTADSCQVLPADFRALHTLSTSPSLLPWAIFCWIKPLTSDVVQVPSLVFKTCLSKALSSTVWSQNWPCLGQRLDQSPPETIPTQIKPSDKTHPGCYKPGRCLYAKFSGWFRAKNYCEPPIFRATGSPGHGGISPYLSLLKVQHILWLQSSSTVSGKIGNHQSVNHCRPLMPLT